MKLTVKTSTGAYDITLERGSLQKLENSFQMQRRALIVTDDGVPAQYASQAAAQFQSAEVITLPQGEQTKSFESFRLLLQKLTEKTFTRGDCVVAVGGGVIGDLAGFSAACYLRGIDFYNIPTTLLSEVDSSVGGKTAIDFCGYKNIVGAFYPPKAVVIDPSLLATLARRQLASGAAEAIKMALTSDKTLFELFEAQPLDAIIDTVIERSVRIKRAVVEEDEREKGARRILNFGHTLAHAIESEEGLSGLLHGESVAIGMLPMCSPPVRERLCAVLKKNGLPTEIPFNAETLIEAMRHDKKCSGDNITVVYCNEVGKAELQKLSFSDFAAKIGEVL